MTINDLITELRQNLNNPDFEYRDVQQQAIEASFTNKHGLFDMTCGVGKTLIQASIIRNAAKNSVKSLVSLFFNETGKHDSEFDTMYLTAKELLSYVK